MASQAPRSRRTEQSRPARSVWRPARSGSPCVAARGPARLSRHATHGEGDLDHSDHEPAPTTQQPAPTTQPASASGRPAWGLFVGLAGAVVVADQLVKQWVLGNLRVEVPVAILGDYVRLTLVHNSGGLFGSFQDQAPIFAIVSLAVMALMVWYHARAGAGDLLLTVTIGLLLGGAIGNFIDRVRFGYVLDFVDAGLGSWRWYTFNVADSAISLAIVLLLLLAVRSGPAEKASRPATGAQPSPDGRPSPDGHGAG